MTSPVATLRAANRGGPNVVVEATLYLGRSHREDRLGLVERLDMAFVIHQEDEGPFGCGQVQPDDVPDLIDEEQVDVQLACLLTVGLDAECRNMRAIVVCDLPVAFAIMRVLLWVAFMGLVFRVRMTIRSTRRRSQCGGQGDGLSSSPLSRLASNLALQVPTFVAAHFVAGGHGSVTRLVSAPPGRSKCGLKVAGNSWVDRPRM